jgi:hypothetical protein
MTTTSSAASGVPSIGISSTPSVPPGTASHSSTVVANVVGSPQIHVIHGTSLVAVMVPAILVIAGWFIVNKTQANRERRKHLRDAAAELQDKLWEIEKITIEYHSTSRQRALEREIVAKLGRFEKGCAALPRFVASQRFWPACKKDNVKIDAKAIQQFRKALTLRHFYDEHTDALDDGDDLIQLIEVACTEVNQSIDDVRIAALD